MIFQRQLWMEEMIEHWNILIFPQVHFSMVAMLPGCDKYMKEIHTINQLCSEVAIATKQ